MLNLRDDLTPTTNQYLNQPAPSLADAARTLDVAGANSLRRGWVSAGIGSHVGDLSNEAVDAGLRGDGLRQAYLMQLAKDEAARAQMWAPTTQNFTDINSVGAEWVWDAQLGGNPRIGTELYYSKNENRQLIQTINLGYYYHKDFQNGLYLSSEFGYRKFFNRTFVDATVGVGYLLIHSALPRYERNGNDYERIGSTFGRIMPTIGLGAGYQFDKVSVFSRYEMFGETPFGYKGVPALPHKALHVGTRFNLK